MKVSLRKTGKSVKINLLLILLLVVGCQAPEDCAGVENGTASIDDCGVCTGGNTELEVNYLKDCEGVCNGDAKLDDCGVCNGDNACLFGSWMADDEFTEICDYVDGECINCEYHLGETEPSDINIIEQDIILTISPITLTVEWCYSYDDFDEEWCNENDDYSDFNCTWDESNNFSTTCNSFETAVLYLDENQLCVDEEYICYDFSISNSGDDLELTGMSNSHCYTIVAHKP